MTILNLHQDTATQDREPLPEWIRWVLGLVGAALVAYFTSQTQTEAARARLEEREGLHYLELKAAIDRLSGDIRELRDRR